MTPRFALKEATSEIHEQLDRLLSNLDLGRTDEYLQFLLIQARVVPPLEAALDSGGIARLVEDWPDHRRADFLKEDLAALGAGMPEPRAIPGFSGDAELLGASYVLEGSRLGAKVLVRSVAPEMPITFLDSPTGTPWPALVAALDAFLYSAQRLEAAKRAATDCFAAFLAAAYEAGLK